MYFNYSDFLVRLPLCHRLVWMGDTSGVYRKTDPDVLDRILAADSHGKDTWQELVVTGPKAYQSHRTRDCADASGETHELF